MKNVVDENTVLEVGKFYNVRCAEIKNGKTNETHCFVPIIGNPHKDNQFSVNYSHYHIDGRFATENDTYPVDEYGKTNLIIQTDKSQEWVYFISGIVIKRKKCKRLTTGIKPPGTATKYHTWYKSMIGKKCKGKKCPHLGTTMLDQDGKWICPLHNLIGCPTTEKIIPYVTN
jgi:hypothetical protein